jgi:arsenite methyltransferase
MVSLALDSMQLAETYDRVGERQFNHGKQLISQLGLRPGQRVLDVGCGTGPLAELPQLRDRRAPALKPPGSL